MVSSNERVYKKYEAGAGADANEIMSAIIANEC